MTGAILGSTLGIIFLIGYIGIAYNARQRARAAHAGLHGEPVNFIKYADESSYFLFELVKLEQERERLKLEKLSPTEKDAASNYLYMLQSNLPLLQDEKWIDAQWQRASRSPAFAKKALAWQKMVRAYRGDPRDVLDPLRLPEPTPEQLVAELAGMSAPTAGGASYVTPAEREKLYIPTYGDPLKGPNEH